MTSQSRNFLQRVASLKVRIEALSSLRQMIQLPAAHDITARQWFVIESELKTVESRLLRQLKITARTYLPQVGHQAANSSLQSLFGKLELELSSAYVFFDTYMDVLTQRHTPELGQLLAGCDVLAWDGLNKDHPALTIVEPPLVYCDRGFGASTLREGIRLPGSTINPLPLVQIPYARLKEKYNLTSILHEIGHEALVRLGLVQALPKALRTGLRTAGASSVVADLVALWSSEIGPDFWAFCGCGLAAAGAMKEIVALPSTQVFRLTWTDPHPPPYLRALFLFDWCRQVWGYGLWDQWEREWLEVYSLESAAPETQEILRQVRQYVPVVGRILLHTKFRTLHQKPISDLFNLSILAPAALQRIASTAKSGRLNLRGLPPSAHLAVFRLLREQGILSEVELDRVMTRWLLNLIENRKHLQ